MKRKKKNFPSKIVVLFIHNILSLSLFLKISMFFHDIFLSDFYQSLISSVTKSMICNVESSRGGRFNIWSKKHRISLAVHLKLYKLSYWFTDLWRVFVIKVTNYLNIFCIIIALLHLPCYISTGGVSSLFCTRISLQPKI